MKARIATMLALSIALARSGWAGPFDPAVVSADAKFVVFVDADAARKTTVGGWLLKRIQDDAKYQEFEKIMIDAAGFMPAADIADVTIYGEKYAEEPDATLVIRARLDANKLSNALSLAKGFELDAYNGHTLMSWIDEDKNRRIHASIVNENTIIMTSSTERLQFSLDVMDDPTKALQEDSPLPKATNKQAWAFAMATDLESSPAVEKNEVLSGLLQRGVIECAEDAGKSSLTLRVDTQTPEQAQQALNAANGLKAILQIAASRRGEVPEQAKLGAELLQSTTATAVEKSVTVSLSLENDKATNLLERAADLPK